MSQVRKMRRGKDDKKLKKSIKKAAMLDAKANHEVNHRYAEKLNKATTWLANLFVIYTLAKDMKMSRAKIVEFVHHYSGYAQDIIDHSKNPETGTTYADIMRWMVIAGKDFDSKSLGWSDYVPMLTPFDDVSRRVSEKNGDGQLYKNLVHAYAITYSEIIFGRCELLFIATLLDYMGYGIKRIKRVVEKIRALTFGDIEHVRIIVKWLATHSIKDDWITKADKFETYKEFIPLCLKPI